MDFYKKLELKITYPEWLWKEAEDYYIKYNSLSDEVNKPVIINKEEYSITIQEGDYFLYRWVYEILNKYKNVKPIMPDKLKKFFCP